ncbi:MAG: hypothetical protein NUV42_00105, partial [Candidatus Yonathbacteria bacterium]|nr:hypothetical protein [Candidatus Yonathbacteria bacterium]
MESLILQDIAAWRFLAYGIIFTGMLFEGEVFLFTAFFLATEGYIDPLDTLFFVVAGTLTGDLLWYFAGPYAEKIGFIKKILAPIAGKIDNQLKKRPTSAILISKFIYGFHRPTLLRARLVGIGLKRFIKIAFPASIAWIAAIAVLAVLFSASIGLFKTYLKFAEIGLLIGIG